MLKSKKSVSETNSEKSKDKNKKSLKMKIISTCVLAFVLIVCSVAWFTIDKNIDLQSMEMSASDFPFEIKTVGTASNENSEILDSLGYVNNESDSSNITSDENNKIYWLMNDESNMKNDVDSEGINPGSYGKLTFYIVPKKSGTMEFTFNLNLTGYKTENEQLTKLDSDSDKNVTDLLSGHIMFFENYDSSSKYYSGHITNGNFNYKIQDAEKGKEYPVTIYWIWPNTLGQLLLTKNDKNINGADPVFQGGSNDRSNFGKYLYENFNQYLDTDKNTNLVENGKLKSDYMNAINSMVSNSTYNVKHLTELSSAYNDADEKIGTTVEYVLLELNAISK